MSAMSDYLENKLVDQLFRGQAAPTTSIAGAGTGVLLCEFCVYVSFGLQQKSTCLNVTMTRKLVQRRPSTARTRESKRPK
jgi:hypothetical protein